MLSAFINLSTIKKGFDQIQQNISTDLSWAWSSGLLLRIYKKIYKLRCKKDTCIILMPITVFSCGLMMTRES